VQLPNLPEARAFLHIHAKPLDEAMERLDAHDRQHTSMHAKLIVTVGALITGAWLVTLGAAALRLMDAIL
jgi:hypothetical protein